MSPLSVGLHYPYSQAGEFWESRHAYRRLPRLAIQGPRADSLSTSASRQAPQRRTGAERDNWGNRRSQSAVSSLPSLTVRTLGKCPWAASLSLWCLRQDLQRAHGDAAGSPAAPGVLAGVCACDDRRRDGSRGSRLLRSSQEHRVPLAPSFSDQAGPGQAIAPSRHCGSGRDLLP